MTIAYTRYKELDEAPALLLNDGDGGDAYTWATPLRPSKTFGNPKAAVYANLSVAAATVVIDCGLYHYAPDTDTWTFLGKAGAAQTATATANTHTDGAGRFPATTILEFDTRGATHYDLRVADPSSGTVDLKSWTYGAKSEPGESVL